MFSAVTNFFTALFATPAAGSPKSDVEAVFSEKATFVPVSDADLLASLAIVIPQEPAKIQLGPKDEGVPMVEVRNPIGLEWVSKFRQWEHDKEEATRHHNRRLSYDSAYDHSQNGGDDYYHHTDEHSFSDDTLSSDEGASIESKAFPVEDEDKARRRAEIEAKMEYDNHIWDTMYSLTRGSRKDSIAWLELVNVPFFNAHCWNMFKREELYDRPEGWTWDEALEYSPYPPPEDENDGNGLKSEEIEVETEEEVIDREEKAKADRRSRRSGRVWA